MMIGPWAGWAGASFAGAAMARHCTVLTLTGALGAVPACQPIFSIIILAGPHDLGLVAEQCLPLALRLQCGADKAWLDLHACNYWRGQRCHSPCLAHCCSGACELRAILLLWVLLPLSAAWNEPGTTLPGARALSGIRACCCAAPVSLEPGSGSAASAKGDRVDLRDAGRQTLQQTARLFLPRPVRCGVTDYYLSHMYSLVVHVAECQVDEALW